MNNSQIAISDIQRLINEMRVMYGKKFTDQWSSVGEKELEQAFFRRLSDLTKEQVTKGFNRMNSEAWPPSIPEFRIWCIQGSNWLTEHEAWLQALAHERSGLKNTVTKATAQALECLKGGYNEIKPNSETQAKAFRDTYVRLVAEAKLRGESQTFLKPALRIEGKSEPERKTSKCPPELAEKLRGLISKRKVA